MASASFSILAARSIGTTCLFPYLIERIEVRGPSAASYGSNALAAVINIQTGSAAEYAGLTSQAAGGSNRIADGFWRGGAQVGPLNYALSLASTGDGGYPGIHDDRRNHLLLLQAELPVGANGELQLLAGYAQGDYQAQNVNPAYPGTFAASSPIPTVFKACNGGNP